MSFWKRLFGGFSSHGDDTSATDSRSRLPVTNPSTGLPMTGNDYGGVDVGGSPYGMDIHQAPYSPPSLPSGMNGTDPW